MSQRQEMFLLSPTNICVSLTINFVTCFATRVPGWLTPKSKQNQNTGCIEARCLHASFQIKYQIASLRLVTILWVPFIVDGGWFIFSEHHFVLLVFKGSI